MVSAKMIDLGSDAALVLAIRAGGMKFSPVMARIWMEQAAKSLSMSDALKILKELQNSARKWVDSYGEQGFAEFRYVWRDARNLVPLQTRLMVEQIVWDKGAHWKGLVSGFKPL